MAFEIPGFQRGWIAGGTAGGAGDLSIARTVNSIAIDSYRYMFVQFSGGLLVPVTAVGNPAVGVLQNKPAPGQVGEVMISGVTRVRSSDASITIGSTVYLDAFGMVSTTPTSSHALGVAEEVSATATGYVIAVCLKPFGAIV